MTDFSIFMVLITCTIILLYWYLTRNFNYWKSKGIPQEKPYPILGSQGLYYFKVCHEEDVKQYKKYGRLHGGYEGRCPFLFLAVPELIDDIMVKDFTIFNEKRDPPSGDPVVDNMLHALGGDDWVRIRCIFSAFFSPDKTKQHHKENMDVCEIFRRNIAEIERQDLPLDCLRHFGAFAMDVLLITAYGLNSDSMMDLNGVLISEGEMLNKHIWTDSNYGLIETLLAKLFFKSSTASAMKYFRKLCKFFIEERNKSIMVKDDFVQLLHNVSQETLNQQCFVDNDCYFTKTPTNGKCLKNFKCLTRDEMIAQCLEVFAQGYNSTKTAMACVAYCLALNPDCQEKLIQEIDTIFNGHKVLDYDIIRNMNYLESIILETLRLYPPFVRAKRRITQEYELKEARIKLQKGTKIVIPIYAIHHDPEYHMEPEKFCPDRFLPINKQNVIPCTYLPFGTGPRNCAASTFAMIQMKTCFATTLRHFRFKRCAETQVPLDFDAGNVTLSPRSIILRLEARTDLHHNES